MPIPSFGNGQELALLLDEYWHEHPELQKYPIFFASGLFQRGMRVYKTYVHTMNANIRSRFARRDNPFDFKYVKWLKDRRRLQDVKGPVVVMASAQFMSFGLSRELLEDWAADSKNGVIVTGYSIEGTMARVCDVTPEMSWTDGIDPPRRARSDRVTRWRYYTPTSDGERNIFRCTCRLRSKLQVHPGDRCSTCCSGSRRSISNGSLTCRFTRYIFGSRTGNQHTYSEELRASYFDISSRTCGQGKS